MSTVRMTREQALAHWGRLVEAQRASGRKVPAWCAEQGISYWQFHYWRRKLERLGGGAPAGGREEESAGPEGFHRVLVSPGGAPSSQPVEIVLPGGALVRVRGGVDRQVLRLVLEEAARW